MTRMMVADAGVNPSPSYSALVGDFLNFSAASRNASRHSLSLVRMCHPNRAGNSSAVTDSYIRTRVGATHMYVGRFLVVGPAVGAYRVSSRSFPNRRAIDRDGTVTVEPTEAAGETNNPYVSYNCVRLTDRGAVLGNGSHVDPIAEKLALGYPARDAVAEPLLALDFEKDDYDTPRIAGVVGLQDDPTALSSAGAGDRNRGRDRGAVVGIVRRDALLVEAVAEPTLVATYERNSPEPFGLDATDAAGAARELYDHEFEHRVCAAGVSVDDEGFETAVVNGAGSRTSDR